MQFKHKHTRVKPNIHPLFGNREDPDQMAYGEAS